MSDNFVPIQLHPPGIYHEYPVSPNLQEYISVYWIHSHDMDTVFEAIPDGCVDLILADTLNTCFVVPTPTKRETYKIPANTPLF